MNGLLAIAKREIHGFFVLPIAYIVLTVWLLYFGLVFSIMADLFSASPTGAGLMNAFFGGTVLFYLPLLVFAPVLTMRLLAEERSAGTLEPLLTAPVSEWSVVLGKYAAALVFWITLWTPTVLYFWMIAGLSADAIDLGAMAATYLGVLCIGLLYMAIGLLMSAISRTQIAAALLTFLVLGALFLFGLRAYATQDDAERALYEYLGVWTQMGTFAKGIVDTRFLAFDLSVAALAVFAAVRVLQSHRWQ